VFTDKFNQFMSILAGSRNANSSGPVKVHMSELVGQLLDLIGLDGLAVLMDHHHMGWGHRALGDGLGHEKKVLELVASHGVVQDCAWKKKVVVEIFIFASAIY
jgi:hypothetical protein